jgi:hypothetical protein
MKTSKTLYYPSKESKTKGLDYNPSIPNLSNFLSKLDFAN